LALARAWDTIELRIDDLSARSYRLAHPAAERVTATVDLTKDDVAAGVGVVDQALEPLDRIERGEVGGVVDGKRWRPASSLT